MFSLCTLISALALSIFGLILKNSKAGSKESKISLQKVNINYLIASVRKHSLDKFRIEMARTPGSPDRPVLWFKPITPFPSVAIDTEQTWLSGTWLLRELTRQSKVWQSITHCAAPGGQILATRKPVFLFTTGYKNKLSPLPL